MRKKKRTVNARRSFRVFRTCLVDPNLDSEAQDRIFLMTEDQGHTSGLARSIMLGTVYLFAAEAMQGVNHAVGTSIFSPLVYTTDRIKSEDPHTRLRLRRMNETRTGPAARVLLKLHFE